MGLEPVADKIEKDGTPAALVVGYVLTGIWAAVLAAYLFWPSSGRWTKLLEVDPNAFGDFLAGAFAPLAFLWLALTVWLQSRELRLQRRELQQNGEALRLQAEELRNSVEQLRKQTELRQTDAQEREREKRERMFAEGYQNLIEILLRSLGHLAGNIEVRNVRWDMPSIRELRESSSTDGHAKVLADYRSRFLRIKEEAPINLFRYIDQRHEFLADATRFTVAFDSWLNGVRYEHFFDLEQRALFDGMVAMRKMIGEMLQAMLPDDDKSDNP